MASRQPKRILSKYRLRKEQVNDIVICDFDNPYTFSLLMLSEQQQLIQFLQHNGLLCDDVICEKCSSVCRTALRSRESEGFSFRCQKDKNHEYSIKRYSMFSNCQINIRDMLVFIRSYLLKMSLKACAQEAGMDYRHSAVDKARFIRDFFKEYVYKYVVNRENPMVFQGTVEIDESLFGRAIKNHRGNPRSGKRVWIVGIVERSSSRLILYPVDDRSAPTLLSIIKRHVEIGSRVFTDGWAGYRQLSTEGYDHFTVNHSHTFNQEYYNETTGESVYCHTNKIEGSWQHAKKHFR